MALTKSKTAETFNRRNLLSKAIESLENCSSPLPDRDWDADGGRTEEYKVRFKKVNREMAAVMAVNFVFNLLMLIPLFHTGKTFRL